MKIGFNVQKIYKNVMFYIENLMTTVFNTIENHELRLQAIEESEWVEITSSNGQEAEITQEFSEIKMQAKTNDTIYSVSCHYDSTIFHNNSSNAPTYMICGNPIENNYGCKFKYMVNSSGNQYVCVDKCFNGGSQEAIEFRAWIKPTTNTQ